MALTPGMCLSERRVDGADLTFRFPRSWLAQWRDVANAMNRLTAQMHGPKGSAARRVGNARTVPAISDARYRMVAARRYALAHPTAYGTLQPT